MNEEAKLISVGGLFRQSWGLYRDRFWPLIGILALGVIVAGGLLLGIMLVFGSVFSEAALIVVAISIILVFYLISGLAMICAIPKGVGIGSAYSLAIKNLISFGWLNILRFLIILGGFIVLVVPGLIFSVWFILANYIFVFDREKGLNALLKSREYIRGYWWQVVGRFVVVFLAYFLIGLVVSFLASLIGETAVDISSFIFDILATPFWVLVLYALYQNFKALKPEVASQPAAGHRGLFQFSAVLGIVGLIVLVVLFFKFVGPDFLSGGFKPEGPYPGFEIPEMNQSELNQLDLPQ